MKARQKALVFFMLLLVGCSKQEETLLSNATFCEYEARYREELLVGIRKAGISITPGASDECFEVKAGDFSKVDEISRSLFGEPPPSGRSVTSSGSGNNGLASILEKNKIPFERRTYKGAEYIIWSFEHGEKVEQVAPLFPEQREMLRRLRLEAVGKPQG